MVEVPRAAVVVDDLWFRYPSARIPALRSIRLTIGRGEFVGVIGPSGAGKSTLCQAIKGIIPHSSPGEIEGQVSVYGTDITSELRLDVTARVGLVLQDPEAQIIGMTVAEDLAFGPENYELAPSIIEERSRRCLSQVGLPVALLGRDTYALSGGQKQRLAIASALMLEPDVLILDEPTSELDPSGKDQVFGVLEALRREAGMTVILVEHEIDRLARVADRLLVMDGGRIVEDDTTLGIFFGTSDSALAGERLPAAVELHRRLRASCAAFPSISPTLDLDTVLTETAAALAKVVVAS